MVPSIGSSAIVAALARHEHCHDRCSRLTCCDILTLTWGLCASVFSMMTEYASTYATSALLKASGLQFTNLSANFSISLSIFCASPGRRNPFKKVLGKKSAESVGTHIQWCRSCTSSITLKHHLQCFLNSDEHHMSFQVNICLKQRTHTLLLSVCVTFYLIASSNWASLKFIAST